MSHLLADEDFQLRSALTTATQDLQFCFTRHPRWQVWLLSFCLGDGKRNDGEGFLGLYGAQSRDGLGVYASAMCFMVFE